MTYRILFFCQMSYFCYILNRRHKFEIWISYNCTRQKQLRQIRFSYRLLLNPNSKVFFIVWFLTKAKFNKSNRHKHKTHYINFLGVAHLAHACFSFLSFFQDIWRGRQFYHVGSNKLWYFHFFTIHVFSILIKFKRRKQNG